MKPNLNSRLNKMKRNCIKGRSLLFALLLSGLFPSLAFAEGTEVYKKGPARVGSGYSQYISPYGKRSNGCMGNLFVKVPKGDLSVSLSYDRFYIKSISIGGPDQSNAKQGGASVTCTSNGGPCKETFTLAAADDGIHKYPLCIGAQSTTSVRDLNVKFGNHVEEGILFSPFWTFAYRAGETPQEGGLYNSNFSWDGSFYGDIENGHVVEFKFDGLKGVNFAIAATPEGSHQHPRKSLTGIEGVSSRSGENCNGSGEFGSTDHECIDKLSDTKYPLFINPPKYTDYATADSRKERQPAVKLVASGGGQCSSQTNVLFGNGTGSPGSLKISLPKDTLDSFPSKGFLRVSCYANAVPESERTNKFIDLSDVSLAEEGENYIYDYSLPTGVAASGDYTCEVQHYVGEVHLDMADAETVGALRMYDVYKDSSGILQREPLYLFWDDSEVCKGYSDCSATKVGGTDSSWLHVKEKTEGGVKSGAYKDNSPIGYHRISGASESEGGNARAWGSYDSSNGGSNNIGNATMMDTWTYYGSSASTLYEFKVIDLSNTPQDNDGISYEEETCIGANPNSLDSDGDGIPDEVECDKGGSLPGNRVGVCLDSDGDGIPDILDLDSDNDGIPDTIEAFDKNHDGKVTLADFGKKPANSVVDPTVKNGDGINKTIQNAFSQSDFKLVDTDGDGVLDYRDRDSDNDGIPDTIEAFDKNHDGKVTLGDLGQTPADTVVDPATGVDGSQGINPKFKAAVEQSSFAFDDADGDSIPNYKDADSDGDGISDYDEAYDYNKDGASDVARAGVFNSNGTLTADADHDGLADQFDPDVNGLKPAECTVVCSNKGKLVDTDGDTVPNYVDKDSDNDGIPDATEARYPNKPADLSTLTARKKSDKNNNGLDDQFDPACTGSNCGGVDNSHGVPPLTNSDSGEEPVGSNVPDFLDNDSDGDGVSDYDEAYDYDQNGVSDVPRNEVFDGTALKVDADHDGLADQFDPDVNGSRPSKCTTVCVDNNGKLVNTDEAKEQADSSPLKPNYIDPDDDGDGTLTKGEVDGDKSPVESKLGGGPAPDYLNDQYPTSTNPSPGDADGISDAVECDPAKGAATDCDNDGDGIKNSADSDSDEDGISDDVECGTDKSNCSDKDHDGVPDYLDLDSDNDGIPDKVECFNPTSCEDTDHDGTPDYLDTDSDNDGILDSIEAFDKNKDGVVDTKDVRGWDPSPAAAKANKGLNPGVYTILNPDGTKAPANFDYDVFKPSGSNPLRDTDGDSTPDYRDLDSDNDGIPDAVECTASTCEDTDGDKVPNYLDKDSDNDGILDEVEAYDKNNDGVVDTTDIPEWDSSSAATAAKNGLNPGIYKILNPDGTKAPANFDYDVFKPSGSNPLRDTDGDGRPNYRDVDSDGDSISDADEAWGDPTTGRLPTGVVSANPADDVDKDGIPTALVARAKKAPFSGTPKNTDKKLKAAGVDGVTGDELPDYLDPDSDGDGIPDKAEAYADKPTQPSDLTPGSAAGDSNNDGMDDNFQNKTVEFTNSDNDSVPNLLDPDSDNDGLSDQDECGVSGACTKTAGKFNYMNSEDTDGDTILDSVECVDANHPVSEYGTVQCGKVDTDGDGVPDFRDLDSDNDGLRDGTTEETEPRVSADTDGDTIPNSVECVDAGHKPNSTDGTVQCDEVKSDKIHTDPKPDYNNTDADGDGILDNVECKTPANCADHDNDGTPDFRDSSYPDKSRPVDSSRDDDKDGILNGDECSESDDPCPDTDKDGVADFKDKDSDNDGLLDGTTEETEPRVSADTDGDTIPNSVECVNASHKPDSDNGTVSCGKVDTDGDGVPDSEDLDSDNDGIPDAVECSTQPCVDTDGDGVPDFRDLDSDNDGILDSVEAFDKNNDGVVDTTDIPEWDSSPTATATKKGLNPGIYKILSKNDAVQPNSFDYGAFADDKTKLRDTDGDGRPNYRDADSDGDGISDADEAWAETSTGRLPTDVAPTSRDDVDKDGIPTKLVKRAKNEFENKPKNTDKELAKDSANGVIGDEIPDYLDSDSDGDGIPDKTEAYLADNQPVDLSDPANSGRDSNNNGMDDAFEGTSRPDLVNSKQGTAPDFINADSDGDNTPDIKEGIVDADGNSITPEGNDSNNNGLDDAFEKTGVKLKGEESGGAPAYRDDNVKEVGNGDTNGGTGNGNSNGGTGNGDTNGGTGNGNTNGGTGNGNSNGGTGNGNTNGGTGNGNTNGGTGNGNTNGGTGDSNADANAENPASFGIVAGGCSSVPADGSVPASLPLLGFLFGLVSFFKRRKK